MLKKLLLILILFSPKFLLAQSYEKEYVTVFAWEVKQIDEFIERFNDSDSTLIKQYNQKHSPAVQLTREKLIKSLFNAERKDWNFKDITAFIAQVNNKESPVFLDFDRDNWFANVNCAVTYNGKPENVLLKLKIQNLPNGSSKWVIADADAKFLTQKTADGGDTPVFQPVLSAPDDTKSLNPVSHITDFLNIDMVSTDLKNLSSYVVPENKFSNQLCQFINECLNNHLKILRATSISYSFLQIKGWDIEIQQFNRPTKNSGWLISKLVKLSS